MTQEDRHYAANYEEYARTKSDYYASAKFEPLSTWGYRNWVRETLIVRVLKNELSARDHLVDVGCASGHTSIRIAETVGCKVCGIDVAPSFINCARARAEVSKALGNLNFEVDAKLDFLQCNRERFTAALAAEVVEHVINDTEFVEILFKSLTPGGLLLITTPNLNGDGTVWGRLARKLGRRQFTPSTHIAALQTGDQHVREYTHETLSKLLESIGFEVVRISGVLMLDSPMFDLLLRVLIRLRLSWLLERCRQFEILFATMLPWLSARISRHLIVLARRPAPIVITK